MRFFRREVPVGHRDFGRLIPCDHPVHLPEKETRLAKVSGLMPEDLKRRLSDIKPVHQLVEQKDATGKPEKMLLSNKTMLEAARAMIEKPYGWLYIWGPYGNAKSEALIAICNELNEQGYGPALYTSLAKILDYMRDAFNEQKQRQRGLENDLGYIDRFNKLKTVKALLIDELDKARLTEFAEEFRFNFLDERYRQAVHGETVTVFASNVSPEQLDDYGPIYDRIRDGRFKIVHNTAGSARPHMTRENS